MAHNYDPYATQNDDTNCDWTLNGLTSYDVDADGFSLGVDFNFGAVDPNNQNDGILNSDFGNAQILFDEGYLNVEDHVIDNLASVMEWIDMDEIRDAEELSDSLTDNYRRYFVNDSTWSADYDTLQAEWVREMADTVEATSNRLADSLAANYLRFDLNDSTWSADYDTLQAEWEREMADTIEATSNRLADTIRDMQDRYDANETAWQIAYAALDSSWNAQFNTMEAYKDSVIQVTNRTLDYHRAPLVINLQEQWNMIAYYLQHPSSVVLQFDLHYF
jgi:hypothetical protein